jgi:hypothetical protein
VRLEYVEEAGGGFDLAVGPKQLLGEVVVDDRGQPVRQRLVEHRLGAIDVQVMAKPPRADRVLACAGIVAGVEVHAGCMLP